MGDRVDEVERRFYRRKGPFLGTDRGGPMNMGAVVGRRPMLMVLPRIGRIVRFGCALMAVVRGVVGMGPVRVLLVRECNRNGLMVHLPVTELTDNCLGPGADQRDKNEECERSTHTLRLDPKERTPW